MMGDKDVARGTEVQDVPSAPQKIFATFHLWKVEITYAKAPTESAIFTIIKNSFKFQGLINNHQSLEYAFAKSLYSAA